MKKIFAVILCIFILVLGSACTGSAVTDPFDTEPPWGTPTNAYEKCTYGIEVFRADDSDNTVLADGTFTQTLSASGEGINNRVAVDSALNVVWKELDAGNINKGKTDEMNSTVLFKRTGMTPVSSKKTMVMEPRTDTDGKIYNHSYEYTVNYENLTGEIKFNNDTSGTGIETKTYSIKSGTNYDNEQLFYLLRSFKNLNIDAPVTFSLNNIAENFIRGNNAPFSLTASTVRESEKTLGDFIDFADDYINNYEKPEVSDVLRVSLRLNDKNPGPMHTFYMAAPSLKFGKGNLKTTKLIVGYEYTVFDAKNACTYRYVYTLTDYTTKQNIEILP